MSECQGENCAHPECNRDDPKPTVNEVREQLRKELGIAPEKWAVMNRAERRAAKRGKW